MLKLNYAPWVFIPQIKKRFYNLIISHILEGYFDLLGCPPRGSLKSQLVNVQLYPVPF